MANMHRSLILVELESWVNNSDASSAVSSSAAYAVLAHNHPSGTLAASYEDKSMTVEVGELLGSLAVRLIDHYIIADGKYIGIKRNCFEIGSRDKLNVPDIFERHL